MTGLRSVYRTEQNRTEDTPEKVHAPLRQARDRPTIAPESPKLGPNSTKLGPMSANLGPDSADFDQHVPQTHQHWPEIDHVFPEVGKIWPARIRIHVGRGTRTILEHGSPRV